MAIVGIVAVARGGAIGKGGTLPWRYPADLKFFKEQTTGHACLMGRRTWMSLPKPLPGRLNVVLSRAPAPEPRGPVVWLGDAAYALALAPYLRCDLYVIGGAQVYEQFLGHMERWVVTEIPLEVEGADTFMPQDFLDGFEEYEARSIGGGLTVRFYRRRLDGTGVQTLDGPRPE